MKSRNRTIRFGRLPEVPITDIVTHMSDPRLRQHMPLLAGPWRETDAAAFVLAKEECWRRDGLGHWAIFAQDAYVGWGGFQKEGDEWDFGLVLRPEYFGLGRSITDKALGFARADPRIGHVSFLLPPSRTHLGALARLGARRVGEVVHTGARFLKFRLETSG